MATYYSPGLDLQPHSDPVYIGFRIKCDASEPGLDGKWDRTVRISYRPKGLPMPNPNKKKRGRLTLPQPGKNSPTSRGAFPPNPDLTKPVSGCAVTDDGVVYLDVVIYGKPDGEAKGLGDDSGDMAGRIAAAVEQATQAGTIPPGQLFLCNTMDSLMCLERTLLGKQWIVEVSR